MRAWLVRWFTGTPGAVDGPAEPEAGAKRGLRHPAAGRPARAADGVAGAGIQVILFTDSTPAAVGRRHCGHGQPAQL